MFTLVMITMTIGSLCLTKKFFLGEHHVPNSRVAQFRDNAVFYRSAISDWSLEITVDADLTVAVFSIASRCCG